MRALFRGTEETGIKILLAVLEAMRSPDSAADVECDVAALSSAILGSATRGATIAAFLFPRPLVYLTSMPEKNNQNHCFSSLPSADAASSSCVFAGSVA